MEDLRRQGSFQLSQGEFGQLREIFSAHSAGEDVTEMTIRGVFEETGMVVDPHTAVGIAASQQEPALGTTPMVVLSTAHPAKFPDAVKRAIGIAPAQLAFRESVARANRWSDHLVEDIELAVKLLLAGGRVDFAPDATVRAEMPETLEDATSQNQRWEAGRAQVAATFVPALADAAANRRHGRRWAYIDAILDLTLPPITTLFALTAVSGAALRLIARGRLAAVGAAVAIGGLAVQIGHTLLSLRLVGAPAAVYRSLLMAPVHIVWKIALLLRMLRRRGPDSWVRTTRNDETETGEGTT